MADSALYTYILAALVAILLYRWRFVNLYDIPTIGPSVPFLSYIGAIRLLSHAKDMLQEGYQKHKGGIFKIAMLDRWLVVVSGPKLVEELRKLPDEQVSFLEAAQDLVQMKYTFGHEVHDDPIHVEIIRAHLTRHIASIFPDVRDEIVSAFNDHIPATSDQWMPVSVLPVMQNIVARVSNRVFVGLPMCRHEEYLRLAITHTMTVARTRNLLTWFPEPLKPIIGFFVNESRRGLKHGKAYLGPTIQDRLNKMRDFGADWSDKPDDMLQWTIDLATDKGKGIGQIVQYVLLTNFAAIHTSSNSFTQALYHLAANPEYIKPLREEVDTVIKEEGWTKVAMQKLKKLDSFMRESQRMNGINVSLMRKAMKDIRFSNGLFIPAGTMIVAPAVAMHMDDENYTNADVFDPWRFSDLRGEEGEITKHQFVSTSVDYIAFGHGKHACPGRFFAANELKAMLAHTVMNYDVKFENEGVRPPNVWFATTVSPDPTAKVLFRKRQDCF
ncbi:unnamed protein product [Somion occarium]|uniref:Cytochrome P450 n=1 Tax=Somion occarium TaxID=3059160 RepID=A0ABP1CEH0_9APHY